MPYEIRAARDADRSQIRALYAALRRPVRPLILSSEFLVACDQGTLVGCGGVNPFAGGGYLYGLAVARPHQRIGIGSALTVARLERAFKQGDLAVVMAMFWNVRFFKRFGFELATRATLPQACLTLPDFQSAVYRRSAILSLRFDRHDRSSPRGRELS